ncbi:hypothetical protein H4R33_001586 [Dimargaris cristalligena]|uniref:Uncharacterized protein n=1 Tax=Dimargaris cristalligena TaxID=215637 RepID=A0A4Q0A212_9FUNG|nr:hypothetical protein H4R33_001586 [Dimargaris cristalligena]RKP40104.1 hypothetical protein BJ085DRAFT_29209 [Dimargaris cristalligena]|eukprot:RKP40104.1 hypothetical protein BJ085DRAFT_29209 [Dimargaris cristalligena]
MHVHRCLLIRDIHYAQALDHSSSKGPSKSDSGVASTVSPGPTYRLTVRPRQPDLVHSARHIDSNKYLDFSRVRVSGILVERIEDTGDAIQPSEPVYGRYTYYLDDGTAIIGFRFRVPEDNVQRYYFARLEASLNVSIGSSVEVLGSVVPTSLAMPISVGPATNHASVNRIISCTGCDIKSDVMCDVLPALESIKLYRDHYFPGVFNQSPEAKPPLTAKVPPATPTRRFGQPPATDPRNGHWVPDQRVAPYQTSSPRADRRFGLPGSQLPAKPPPPPALLGPSTISGHLNTTNGGVKGYPGPAASAWSSSLLASTQPPPPLSTASTTVTVATVPGHPTAGDQAIADFMNDDDDDEGLADLLFEDWNATPGFNIPAGFTQPTEGAARHPVPPSEIENSIRQSGAIGISLETLQSKFNLSLGDLHNILNEMSSVVYEPDTIN